MSEFDKDQEQNDDAQYQEKEPVISSHKKCMLLKICVDSEDAELIARYRAAANKHNAESEEIHYNSGFDLFMPNELSVNAGWFLETKMIDHRVKCEAFMCAGNDDNGWELIPTGFYLYPRSSMSKEPLMLANHVGIIDSGYRGNLIAAVRNLNLGGSSRDIPAYSRLFQVCAPTLCPIHVILVGLEDFTRTERGEGGFGSSGV